MSNCGCSPSGYPSTNNECCGDVANLARFTYANAQQAAASAANAATTLADAVQKSGDTMTGPLILSGDPVALLGAASKQYVDNAVSIGLTIPDGSITTPKLANLAVDSTKLADGSVTTIKLATNAVDASKIQDLTITTNKIADNQVTAAKLDSMTRLRIAKAWVNFNGTTSPGTIRSSYNVSSVTKTGSGDYTINFTTALADANYSITITTASLTASQVSWIGSVKGTPAGGASNKTASAVSILTGQSSTNGIADTAEVNVIIFGN